MGDLTVMVPREEQSWKGKAMTRFGDLVPEPFSIRGTPACKMNGTPADCANYGVHHLFDGKPDLVVSGINIGVNTGIGFVISSGTVGACFEANIAGVPGVALSQELDRTIFEIWARTRQFPHDEVAPLRRQMREMTARLFGQLGARDDFLTEPVTWSVNMPSSPAPDWGLVATVAGQSWYGSCFKRAGEVFHHDVDAPSTDLREGTDIRALKDGHVSVTRIDLRKMAQELWR
jgi:5'-nucleotidase